MGARTAAFWMAAAFCSHVVWGPRHASAASVARTENFDVVSDLGPEVVGPAAAYLELTRERYLGLGLTLREPGPVTAIVVPTIVELAPYVRQRSGRTRGLSLVAPDRNYIVIAWHAPGDPLAALAHEYAHLVDRHPQRPTWFREGLADYLSLLQPDEAGELRATVPAGRLSPLLSQPWLPHDAAVSAKRGSAAFADRMFYSQAWLAMLWLASQQPDVRLLEPAPFESLDPAEAEQTLRDFAAGLRGEPEQITPPPAEHVPVRPADPSEVDYWLADLDRFIDPERARDRLQRLAAARPSWPRPQAALGALAVAAGRFGEAEALLAFAVQDPEADAATHHRYAQVLLQPSGDEPAIRAERAALHAGLALDRRPENPRFRLTRAQAQMVAEDWNAAAGTLQPLLALPAWRGLAEREFEEIRRRQWQAAHRVRPPAVSAGTPEKMDPALLTTLAASPVPKPQAYVEPAVTTWPPPGATVIYGRIDRVDCSGAEKLIILRHPLFRMHFREPAGRPAKLFFPPDKSWKEIPCGAKGWTINLAYKPASTVSDIRGEAVAILF